MSTYRTLGEIEDIRYRLVERRHRHRRAADYELASVAEQIGFWYGSACGRLCRRCATLIVIWLAHL